MPIDEVSCLIRSALVKLYDNDIFLINNKTNERSIAACLACYLKAEFSDWDVDAEYNREGYDPKKDEHQNNINPDIIIHKRGTKNNLVAIEIKGYWNGEDRKKDEEKLKGLLRKQGYKYAFRIELEKGGSDLISIS